MNLEDIKKAAKIVSENKVVAIPTETVYGLAANIFSKKAVTAIYKIKNRPLNNPLIVHIKDIKELPKYTKNIPEKAQKLADKFWPGPLTLVLPKAANVPDYITSNKDTVAIRVPSHKITLALLHELEFPLAAPSANPSNAVSATSYKHVRDYFGNKIPYILDGGECSKGLESTIIGFENNKPILYRLGAIAIEEIEKTIGKIDVKKTNIQNPEAPGMFLKHYSPKTPLYLVENTNEFLNKTIYKNIAYLGFNLPNQNKKIKESFLLSTEQNFEIAAANLYKTLIKIDTLHFDAIVADYFPNENLGKSINDRLIRASYKN
ncbi:L-threonylcarbamoyladenylate synthase [Flavobacterium sp.]|uniref:L-threonylcarbamoyladenylate synthase n=1 Tax=Flavobacterium sp. TaxID=239 RepID=UPI0040470954